MTRRRPIVFGHYSESTPTGIGYAWVFEKGIIYGNGRAILAMFASQRRRMKYGELLGVVRCQVPIDPYCIPYELFDTPAFLDRMHRKRHKLEPLRLRWKKRTQQTLKPLHR